MDELVGEEQELRGSSANKYCGREESSADGNENGRKLVRNCEGESEDTFDFKGLRTKRGDVTDSKGWSFEQPKSEGSWKEGELECGDVERRYEAHIEERLSRLGLGNRGDGAVPDFTKSKIGTGDFTGSFEVAEEESLILSKRILDECVQMVVEERCLSKKDGFKEIYDADEDEAQERRTNHSSGEQVKSTQSPRSSWEFSRPSPTPRLAAWLLKAGASEAQVPLYD